MSQNALAAGLTNLGLNLPEDAPHQLLEGMLLFVLAQAVWLTRRMPAEEP